ncbi:MAG TPA: lipocalin family protein [Opitutaceae bacterium]|nr:lipocalin family protein [Opitutaceae bacterium]
MIPRRLPLLFSLMLAVLGASAAAQDVEPDLRTTAFVDLSRFMGRWWVISHTPNFIEKGKVGTSDTYTAISKTKLKTVFTFRKDSLDAPEEQWNGTARIINTTTNADWKVRLIWPFESRYRVLDLDPNYGWAVVSNGNGKLIWVLSRTRKLDEYTYKVIMEHLRQRRCSPASLERVPQAP